MEILLFIVAMVIIPIAIPAWAIEGLIRRKKTDWEFNTYTAIPYFSLLTYLSSNWLLGQNYTLQILGLYISLSMFLLSFCLSIVILIGTESTLLKTIRKYADRKYKYVKTTFTTGGILRGIIGFFFAIYAYGSIYFFLNKHFTEHFAGLTKSSQIEIFFDSIYYSFSTITTLGSDVKPISIIAKIITASEVFIGVFYLIFLFGAMISIHISRVYDKTK